MTSLKILKHPNQRITCWTNEARALDDVAASLINNGFAVEAGFQPTKMQSSSNKLLILHNLTTT